MAETNNIILTNEQIEILDNMCFGANEVQLGTLLKNMGISTLNCITKEEIENLKLKNIQDGESEGSVHTINAIAQSEHAFASGINTIAGSMAYTIKQIITSDEDYTLVLDGSVDGKIAVGDIFSYQLVNNYDFYGKITSLEDMPGISNPVTGEVPTEGWVTVDKFYIDDTVGESPQTQGTLWIPFKPMVGTKLWGAGAHVEGYENIASSVSSHAEGYGNISGGKYSHTEGKDNIAGYAAHSEGMGNKSIGQLSHTEGRENIAFGATSHAEGGETEAQGIRSHSEGNKTKSLGAYSHAEGSDTITEGIASHAEGYGGAANADYSHVEGLETKIPINAKSQHVQGKFNVLDWGGKYAHIVGNGIDNDNRSNAHTLDWNGVGWFAGGLKVGGTGQNDSNAQEVVLKSELKNIETSIKNMNTTLEMKVNKSDVLTKTNTATFTPTSDYHPATKKYVDDAVNLTDGIIMVDRTTNQKYEIYIDNGKLTMKEVSE